MQWQLIFPSCISRSIPYYLGQIFGVVGNVLPVNNPNLLVSTLFRTFNTIALTVGIIIVVYVIVVGLFATAHEGEFMGRQWNQSVWTPIRMIFGIAALFPTASGYSIIQVVIMWIVIQSIGAADTVWKTALNYLQVAGSPYATLGGSSNADISSNMGTLFQALVCQASAKRTDSDAQPSSSNQKYYYCADSGSDSAFCGRAESDMLNPVSGPQSALNDKGTAITYSMGPFGSCGTLTIPALPTDTTSLAYAVIQAQQETLQLIVPALGAVADAFVQADNDYIHFYYANATSASATPTWLQNYCAARQISATACCIAPPASQITSILFGGNTEQQLILAKRPVNFRLLTPKAAKMITLILVCVQSVKYMRLITFILIMKVLLIPQWVNIILRLQAQFQLILLRSRHLI